MSHPKRLQKIERSAEKRAIEIARYVLPVAAFTTMVHTVSGIVLHRLWRMSAASDTPNESRAVIGAMVDEVKKIDPQFFDRFGTEPLEERPEWNADAPNTQAGEAFASEFDAKLAGKTSKLLDYSPNAPRVIAESYRAVLGLTESQCSDSEAIDRLLNPGRNPYRLETLDIGVHAPMMRALQHANYTFAKKISHTADSQDQRHRMVPGSRPLLTLADTRDPDYITPALLTQNPRAKELYDRAMHDAWSAKNDLLDRGVPLEIALYLLPNAKSIRLVEIRLPPPSPPQMDHAHLLQRPGRNLRREHGRSRPTPPSPSPTRKIHRPSLPSPRQHHHPHLHRGLPLLRRKSLARLPQHPPPHLASPREGGPTACSSCPVTHLHLKLRVRSLSQPLQLADHNTD